MNPNPTEPKAAEDSQTMPPVIAPEPAPRQSVEPEPTFEQKARQWLRYLLIGNPFYILSAVLLLYSMNRLSNGSGLFLKELPQLIFNFSSFQVYELLLAGTAIFLARRQIAYDAGLLVTMEQMFLFVPFILISQALLIEGLVAATLCVVGFGLAVMRMGGIWRWVTGVNLPRPLLGIGAVLLLVNLVAPVLVRVLHKNAAMPLWSGRAEAINAIGWLAVGPLAVAASWFLPWVAGAKDAGNEGFHTRHWFPMFALGFWIAGTMAHFYCIGYLYGFPWHYSLLAPILWVAAWMLWLRRGELGVAETSRWNAALLLAPLGVGVWTMTQADWALCLPLAGANIVAYAAVALRRRDAMAFNFVLLSAALAMGAVPNKWFMGVTEGVGRAEWVTGNIMGWLVLLVFFSRNPKLAVPGSLAAAFLAGGLLEDVAGSGYMAAQVGIVFLLLHSLRWVDSETPGARGVRGFMAWVWLAHSGLWVMDGGAMAGRFLPGMAIAVLGVCGILYWVRGVWGPKIVPVMAVGVLVMPLVSMVWGWGRTIPEGVLVLIASFGLFGLGTLTALLKGQGHRAAVGHSDGGRKAGV